MPTFEFIARDRAARTERGRVEAATDAAAAAELRARGLVLVDLRPAASERTPSARGLLSGLLRVRSMDVEVGLRQLAFMLRSGLPLLKALRIVASAAPRASVARLFDDVGDRVQQGSGLSTALADRHKVDRVVVAMVAVGEQTGELDRVLDRAADGLARRREMRTQLLTALSYPTIVVVLAVCVVAYLLVELIPKLRRFLAGFGRRLPDLTQALLDVSGWVESHGLHILIGFIAATLALLAIRAWPPGRLSTDRLVLRIPVFGAALRLAATATFARTLGTLLDSGVRVTEGLRVVADVHGNRHVSGRVHAARDSVLEGGSLAPPLARGRAFLPMLPSMVEVGESSGTLGAVLGEVATFHEARFESFIRRASTIFEPVVILLVGGIVGFVYLAFFSAIYSIAGGR